VPQITACIEAKRVGHADCVALQDRAVKALKEFIEVEAPTLTRLATSRETLLPTPTATPPTPQSNVTRILPQQQRELHTQWWDFDDVVTELQFEPDSVWMMLGNWWITFPDATCAEIGLHACTVKAEQITSVHVVKFGRRSVKLSAVIVECLRKLITDRDCRSFWATAFKCTKDERLHGIPSTKVADTDGMIALCEAQRAILSAPAVPRVQHFPYTQSPVVGQLTTIVTSIHELNDARTTTKVNNSLSTTFLGEMAIVCALCRD